MNFKCLLLLMISGSIISSIGLPMVLLTPTTDHLFPTISSDAWNISSLPRSTVPLLKVRNGIHAVPLSRQESFERNAIERLRASEKTDSVAVTGLSCTSCKAVVSILHFQAGKGREDLMQTLFKICMFLKVFSSPEACKPAMQLFGDVLYNVLKILKISPGEVCSFIIDDDECSNVQHSSFDWEVEFPLFPKPNSTNAPLPKRGVTTFKVLHLSDFHYDPHYAEGSNVAACKDPFCCRWTEGNPPTPSEAAGKWGDYRFCDTPKRTIDHMLDHISVTHPDIDYILWTGDLIAHDPVNQSKEYNLNIINETVTQMYQQFAGIPIFAALGNHEAAPVNAIPPPDIQQDNNSVAWLYDELDIQWRKWFPASTSPTIRRGAFYSVLIRPGFRIISLNMNYCHVLNFWLLISSNDPATELQWLIQELQAAELAGEKVHIIGHIPPGKSDCSRVWSRNYYKIIARYENTVTAQFFGHTHFDEFEVFYDPINLRRAMNIAYIGPSVTPYFNLNPGYRIYYVDGDHENTTRSVIDHENWILDLNEANLSDNPIWYKLYSARAAYGMEGLRPSDWDKLIHEMTNNQETFDLYHKYYWKNSPVRPSCDLECKKQMLCDAKSGRSRDRKTLCNDFEPDTTDGNEGLVNRSFSDFVQANGTINSLDVPNSTTDGSPIELTQSSATSNFNRSLKGCLLLASYLLLHYYLL